MDWHCQFRNIIFLFSLLRELLSIPGGGRGMVAAERAGAAARKLRLEGLQAAANDFWSHLCDYSTAPSAQRLAQQVRSATAQPPFPFPLPLISKHLEPIENVAVLRRHFS